MRDPDFQFNCQSPRNVFFYFSLLHSDYIGCFCITQLEAANCCNHEAVVESLMGD